MEQVRSKLADDAYLPILVITADITPEAKRRALSAGATDFLTKPIDAIEVGLRVGNLLEIGGLHEKVIQQNRLLQETLDQKVRELTALNKFMQPFLERRVADEDAMRWLSREMSQATERITQLVQKAQEQRAALQQ